MTDQEHADMLAKYFTALFGPEETIHIYPTLTHGMDRLVEQIESVDEVVGSKEIKYQNYDWDKYTLGEPIKWAWFPIRQTKPFSRKASVRHTRLIRHLKALTDVGYDIFFSINPLTGIRRCQKTVRQAYHVLLESDDESMSIDEQLAILKPYSQHFSAITYSGGKSLHALLRIRPEPCNPHRVNWREARDLKDGDTSCDWQEYRDIAQYWIEKLKEDGLNVDGCAAVDCSRVSRVPGFPHSKTGQSSEVLLLNASAEFNYDRFRSQQDWDSNFKPLLLGASVEPTIERKEPDINVNNSKYSSASYNEDLFINKSINSDKSGPNQPIVVSCVSNTAMTNVMHMGNPKRCFLDDLVDFEGLLKNGIPARHTRRGFHPIVFRACRILGMTEDEMIKRWERIISIAPNNIGCTTEEAVADFITEWKKGKAMPIYLPDCTCLPDLDDAHLKTLRQKLTDERCPNAYGACRIIEKVLWDQIRQLPRQCTEGSLGIRSRELQAVSKRYTKPFGWMKQARLVTMTDDNFSFIGSRKRTRKYRVNIPLLLCWLGFKSEELTWSKASGESSWDELAA